MALETVHKKPEVILTTRVKTQTRVMVRYLRCLSLILIAYFLSAYPFGAAWPPTLLTFFVWFGGTWVLEQRPTILLDGKKNIEISGIGTFKRGQKLPARMVAQVRVEVEREGSYGDADGGRKWYVPQIMLRAPKKSKTRLVIKGFPLENIVQAHYVAQLIGAYTRAEALDFKGNPLPPLKTHIPTKFLAHQTDTMKSVASAMKNPQTQKPSAAAENPA